MSLSLMPCPKIRWAGSLSIIAGVCLIMVSANFRAPHLDVQVTQVKNQTSSPVVMLNQTRDRLDQADQVGAKANLNIDIVPSSNPSERRLKRAAIGIMQVSPTAQPESLGSFISLLEDQAAIHSLPRVGLIGGTTEALGPSPMLIY
jgi:hypothetical protein